MVKRSDVIFTVVAGILLFVGLSWLIEGNNFFLFRVFAPAREAVRRDTMIQSRAYSEATQRRLYELQRQIAHATTEPEKDAIKALARHEAQGFDVDRLPADLRVWVRQLQ